MSAKSFSAVATACFLATLAFSNSALAVTQQNQLTQQDINKILKREQKLEQEVSALSAEVKEIKASQPSKPGMQQHQPHLPSKESTPTVQHYQTQSSANPNALGNNTLWHPSQPQFTPEALQKLNASRLTRGVSVTTSPYLGLRSEYDGMDLIVNTPTLNQDLFLLWQRQKLENQAVGAGIPLSAVDNPLLELSGAIEGQAVYNKPFQGNTNNTIDLTRAQFDLLSYVSPWVTGFMSFKYDNSPLPANIQGSGQRGANSRVYVDLGFLTIGNLNRFPVYFSLGQMNAPFGRYFSYMLTNPLTQSLGQTRNRIALLGFAAHDFFAQGYVFKGDANTSNNNSGINNGGVNVGYKHSGGGDTFALDGGYINDIADSLGMQKTGASPIAFQGFGFSPGTETLVHKVPGVNVNSRLTLNKLTLLAEFISATRSFDPMDLSFNNGGAQPKAMHLEGDYNFNLFHKPSAFTLAYGHSWQALGINIPQDSYIAEITTSIWKDTIESLEYRHDTNYPSSDTSGGRGFPAVASVGGSQNTVTLQAGVYF